MANLEVLALDTAVPQIRAPGAGDGYSVPRDMTLASGTTLAAQAVTSTSLGTTGNLTFSGTGQRITGDMSNATIANRLAFQTSTTNGVTNVGAIPNGTAVSSGFRVYGGSDPNNATIGQILQNGSAETQIRSDITGTGTYAPLTFYTGGSERMRLDTSGNLLVGTATSVGGVRLTSVGGGVQLSGGTTAQEGVRIQRATGYATFTGINNDNNAYNGLQFFTSASAAATIDTSGNVGIGTTSPVAGYRLNVVNDSGNAQQLIRAGTNFNSTIAFGDQDSSTSGQLIYAHNGDYMAFNTNAAERMRITSTGNIVAGASAALATTATDGFLYVPTCAGTPTGTPTAITGMAPIVVNTTNNKLYFYSGGAWRDAGP